MLHHVPPTHVPAPTRCPLLAAGDLLQLGALQDLTDVLGLLQYPLVLWQGVEPSVRDNVATLGGRVYGLPLDGGTVMMYYRADVLAARNISVPASWEQLLLVAQQLHGQVGGLGARRCISLLVRWFLISCQISCIQITEAYNNQNNNEY